MVHRSILCCLVAALVHLGQCSRIVPPLYRYDDYFQCQRESQSGVFCFVKVVLSEPQKTLDSPRLETSFRHDLLDWGVCVSDCQRELADISTEQRQRLIQPKFQINFTYILPADHWGTYVENFKLRYGTLINVCVNHRLEHEYNLSQLAYSEIEYCTTRDELDLHHRKTSRLVTVAFYATVLMLVGFTAIANVFDLIGNDQAREHIIVSSFSIRRNWARLTDQPKSMLYRDFGYINGLRVCANFYLMILHIILVTAVIPVGNPEYSETVLKTPLMIDIMALSPTGPQLFFVIGGLLLAVTVLQDMNRKPQLQHGYFRTKIRSRLIRIAPVYYFCLLITLMGDELPGVHLGPVGYKSLIQEQGRCRKKWWASMLFVNNLAVFGEERCNFHGWYLSADFQLFFASLLLLLALGKYPKRAKAVLWTCAIIALVIPIVISYQLGLSSAAPVSLSDAQYEFMHQPWFNHVYTPSYTNLNSYLAGVIVGYLYHHTKYHWLNLDNSMLYGAIKKLCVPFLAAAYLPTFLFYQYEISRSSWLTVLHNILYQNAAVIAQSVCFIECFRNPPGKIRAFLSSPAMTSLGKLVYSVYVLHYIVMRLILNQFTPEYTLNFVNVPWIVVGVTILSYLVGLVGYLIIEQPLGLLLKHMWDGGRKKIKTL